MLIQFTVENYRSFRERTVFSMRKASNVERREDAPDVVKGTDILRCAAMYGANASGKSNFVKALSFARNLVIHGVSERGRIRAVPFRLDEGSVDEPSRFEIYLRATSGKVYGYGFIVQPSAVVQEWLSELDGDQEIEIFSRDGSDFQFAPQHDSAAGELLNLVGSATRNNQLLLRTTREFRSESFPRAFADVMSWFEDTLTLVAPDAMVNTLVAEVERNEPLREFLADVLRGADTGITGLRTVRRPLRKDEEELFQYFRPDMLHPGLEGDHGYVEAVDGKLYRVELRLKHAGGNSSESEFGLDDESEGTVRLLDLSSILFNKYRSHVFVVDELDRSLHTTLSRWLIERFIAEAPGHESQLIFTTHDTNIFDVDALRQDAFWFAEKDKSGASTLYSLAEFKAEQIAELRSDLERAYLVGRFGGVPRIRGAETP